MVIQVLLKDPRSGSEKRYEFDQSPVRIGRNPLNNVVLEGNFVSGWHGIIRFDATGAYYFDLGSTNGTSSDGKRLQKNTPIPILQPMHLTIWMFELTITPAVPGSVPSTLSTPQHHPAVLGTLANTSRNTEVIQVVEKPHTPGHAQPSPSRIIPVGGHAPTTSHPMSASDGHPAQAAAPRPAQEQPQAQPQAQPQERPQDRLIRCLRIIGAFCDAFMGLKKGYEQFGSEVGVRPLTGTTPLHRARTSQELVEYLLDPAIDPDACARDLNAVFADMGIHDVALMEGISQSVRVLLAKLDPSALDFKMGAGLWSGSKAKAKWNTYVETFNNLLGEDAALHAEIFGEEFASAYASVALGDENAAKDDGE